MVAKALVAMAPADVGIRVYELNDLPFFNADLEADLPQVVQEYVDSVRWADALIFSTPEYNNMLPGVLKNACEWLTRGYSNDAVINKPMAIVGASDGGFGTVRAQNQLLLLAVIMRMQVSADLRLPISKAQDVFSATGELVDESVREKLSALLNNLLSKLS